MHRRVWIETALWTAGILLGMRYVFLPWIFKYTSKNEKKKSKVVDTIAKARGVSNISLNSYEQTVAECLVNVDDLDVDFTCIGGYDKVKKAVSEAILVPFKHPELYSNPKSLRQPPKGILFYGPPGTGKTLLCQAIAKECKCTFMNLQRETIGSYLFGESEKLLAAVFSLAEKLAPTIIFIDEIETVLFSRTNKNLFTHEVRQNQLSMFLSLWDGFNSNQASRVIVIGATNLPQNIDPAAMRRLPVRFRVDLPTTQEREQILKVLLRNDKVDAKFDWSLIAEKTDTCSGSDLKELCKKALAVPMSDFLAAQSTAPLESQKPELRPLSTQDFLHVLASTHQ